MGLNSRSSRFNRWVYLVVLVGLIDEFNAQLRGLKVKEY